MGDAVGYAVGYAVGALVGDAVGYAVGALVGDAVGYAVGYGVGMATHSVQPIAPVVHLPTAHGSQSSQSSWSWNVPAGQWSQLLEPAVSANWPPLQSVHSAPVLTWNWPAAQSVHSVDAETA